MARISFILGHFLKILYNVGGASPEGVGVGARFNWAYGLCGATFCLKRSLWGPGATTWKGTGVGQGVLGCSQIADF